VLVKIYVNIINYSTNVPNAKGGSFVNTENENQSVKNAMVVTYALMINRNINASHVPPPVLVSIAKPFLSLDPNGNPTVFDATVYYIQMQ
jgi:hypothetical protein